jgi:hypothetical protein
MMRHAGAQLSIWLMAVGFELLMFLSCLPGSWNKHIKQWRTHSRQPPPQHMSCTACNGLHSLGYTASTHAQSSSIGVSGTNHHTQLQLHQAPATTPTTPSHNLQLRHRGQGSTSATHEPCDTGKRPLRTPSQIMYTYTRSYTPAHPCVPPLTSPKYPAAHASSCHPLLTSQHPAPLRLDALAPLHGTAAGAAARLPAAAPAPHN